MNNLSTNKTNYYKSYFLESVKSSESTTNEKVSISMDEILQREMEENFEGFSYIFKH